MGKAPAFQFYPADWLKDPALKRCSFRAKGVWIDLLCNAFECEEKGVFRDKNGPFSRQEILEMLNGKMADKKKGFKELEDKVVIKQMEDKSYYSKLLREICRISAIRKEAGCKGGNPNLLVNQNVKQNAKQKPTPSSSSSSSNNNILNCPQKEIVDMFHAILPELPKVKIWEEGRQKLLKARCIEILNNTDINPKERGLIDWWTDFFKYIHKCPFLMGDIDPGPGRKRFFATLPWIIKKVNFMKIIEGNYDN